VTRIEPCDTRLYNRTRTFPASVENAYRKLRELEAEAARLGFRDIHKELSAVNRAWDIEISRAKLDAQMLGEESSMAVNRL
jgi:hypothetical protein